MRINTNRALLGAALSLTLAPAAAGATTVSVRIEGAKQTLLSATGVKLPAGRVTKSGAGCPGAGRASGALDAATHHRWVGSYSKSFADFSVTGILGETHSFTSNMFWEVLVNDVASQNGICGTKLRRGDRVLFAAVPVSGTANPLALQAPGSARVGQTVTVTVKVFVGAHAKLASGVTVTGSGVKAKSNHLGQVKVKLTRAGSLTLHAGGKGYIRDEATIVVHS